MIKSRYFCDHCGKEIYKDDEDSYIQIDVKCCDTDEVLDLCEDCYGELDDLFTELLNNFIKDEEDDE